MSDKDRPHTKLDRWRAQPRNWSSRHRYTVWAAAIFVILIAASAAWFAYIVVRGLPATEQLRALSDESGQTTAIYDAYERVAFTIPTEHQIAVPLSSMSRYLLSAIVAVEDQRFYEHKGVDHLRVLAAAFANIRQGRAVQGGSTITQQLARQSFLTRDKTLRRKVREVIVAEQLEHLYSKDQILELYLNRVYFGNGLYGAEAAARGFFGKTAAELTLGEAAMLAGIVRAPSATNPVANLERAIDRRDMVLQLLQERGVADALAVDSAKRERVILHDTLRRDDPIGRYFKEHVRRWLIEQFGEERLVTGRLRVYTTMDPKMQQAAEAAVLASLRDLDARTSGSRSAVDVRRATLAAAERSTKSGEPRTPNDDQDDRLQAALVAIDPRNGEVRAIVGGRDATNLGLNRAVQARRQPGSAFKPFVYAAALERGYTPASLIEQLDKPIPTFQGAWIPEDEHSAAPSMTIRTALRTSSNRAAVHMLEQVGIEQTISYAQRLGIGNVPPTPSLALGSGDVTLLSMTAAYAAFAHAGVIEPPIFIRRVEDREGNILYGSKPAPRQVLTETTAFLMANMLADVVDMGTASGARAMGFTLPAAGKTGTTNNFVDAWFVGFTPRIVAGVWVGYDRPRTIMKDGFAGRVAVPLWARFMKEATRNDGNMWFEPPRDVAAVQICRVSGLLPAEGCADILTVGTAGDVTHKSMVYTEYFALGTEPLQTCPIHVFRYEEPIVATTGILDIPRFQWDPIPPAPPPPPPVYAEPPTTPVRVTTEAPPPPPPPPPAPPAAPPAVRPPDAPALPTNDPPAEPINPDSLPAAPPGP
jgi:1A family penicillin-binding protein